MDRGVGRRLRKDAVLNRERIVAVATDLFRQEGIHVPFEEIARRANVGKGTLYRHFPNKASLLEEIYRDQIVSGTTRWQAALEEPDAGQAFCTAVWGACERMARDHAMQDLIRRNSLGTKPVIIELRHNIRALRKVMRRAQEQGSLRSDVGPSDIYALFWGVAEVSRATRDIDSAAWRRFVALQMSAMQGDGKEALPRSPLSDRQLLKGVSAVAPGLSVDGK